MRGKQVGVTGSGQALLNKAFNVALTSTCVTSEPAWWTRISVAFIIALGASRD